MSKIEYKCDICNFICGNRKSHYMRHVASKKHITRLNTDNNISPINVELTAIDSQSSLAYNQDFQMNMIIQEIILLKSQYQISQRDIFNLKTQISSLEIRNEILNKELQFCKIFQRTETVPTKKIDEPEIKKNTTKQTLSEYLNTECKDAVDYDEFRRYKNIDFEEVINIDNLFSFDSEEVVRKLVKMNLERTPITLLPIRCVDYQNKKVVIKINGQWYRASDEDRDALINWGRNKLNEKCLMLYDPFYDKQQKNIDDCNEEIDETKKEALIAKLSNEYIKITNLPILKKENFHNLLKDVLKYCRINCLKKLDIDHIPIYKQPDPL